MACAWASNVQQLLWLRFLSGLGLGGVLPNVIALKAVVRLARKLDPALAIVPGTRFVLDRAEGSAKTRGSPAALFYNGWAPVTMLVWLTLVVNLMANNLMNAWLPMIVENGGRSATEGAYAGSLYQLGGSIVGSSSAFLSTVSG